MATQSAESDDHGIRRRTGLHPASRAYVGLVLLLGLGVAGVLLWPAAKWALMEAKHAVHYVSGFAGLCILAGVVVHIVGHPSASHGRGEAGQSKGAGVKGSRVGGWFVMIGVASLAVGAEMAVHFAASDIHHHMRAALPGANQLYANHDVARLVGETLRVMTLKARDEETDSDTRTALLEIARVIPAEWVALASAHDSRVVPLTEQELWLFIERPGTAALDNERWSSLVEGWAVAARVKPLGTGPSSRLVRVYTRTFSMAWREALKHDFTHGGKASEAMRLDLFGELLRRSADNANTADPATENAVAAMKEIPATLASLAERVSLRQDRHARLVFVRFDEVVGILRRVEGAVVRVEGKLEQMAATQARSLTIQEVWIEIERTRLDELLSPEQKQVRIAALLLQVPRNQSADAPRLLIPSAAVRSVEQVFEYASPLQRFAALARIGADVEGDRLARQLEEITAGFSDAQRYQYFVASGDSHWLSRNYWMAATSYGQALALRCDDPQVVIRGADSTRLAPGTQTYARDLEIAIGWLDRCNAAAAHDPLVSARDHAQLLQARARALHDIGRRGEAIGSAREALFILSSATGDTGSDLWFARLDLAEALHSVGQLTEAAAVAEAAMALAQNSAGDSEMASARTAAVLARILRARGDLTGAEEAISRSILWEEAQSSRDDRGIAINYGWRARIRMSRGNQVGAAADIAQSIAWGELQEPRDEHSLASWRDTRAQIRHASGDTNGSAEDIGQCIAWLESQEPRDQWSLGNAYATRAGLGMTLGDLDRAASDITRSIGMAEAVEPRDERSLAIWNASLARIQYERGRFAEAKTRINRSLAWCEAQTPRNERFWAIWRVSRACILRESGELEGARADIDGSILWAQSQTPAVWWDIAVWRGERATIHLKQGDSASAIRDIRHAVNWLRPYKANCEYLFARLLRDQARILAAAERWDEARAAVDESVALHEALFGQNHKWTAIVQKLSDEVHAGGSGE